MTLPTGEEDPNVGRAGLAGLDAGTTSTGGGTFDALLGVTYVWPISDEVSFFNALSGSIPLDRNDSGSRPGNALFETFGVNWRPVDEVSLILSANAEWVSHREGGTVVIAEANSGAFTMSVTPGVVWRIAEGFGVEASVQIPVFRQVVGSQIVSGEIWSLGVFYTF